MGFAGEVIWRPRLCGARETEGGVLQVQRRRRRRGRGRGRGRGRRRSEAY